jgi:hypothetical protein
MLKLLSETKNNRPYDSIEGFNIFHILEDVFLRVNLDSLLPSDRVLVELYRYKYNHYAPKDEVNLIESIIENGNFNTWREAVEAYIYSYILLQRNNCNKFEVLKECTKEFLNQLEIIDSDLWDDDLGFALGLTVKFQDNFMDKITNSLIKRANPIFKLNYYFGMKVRENWGKPNRNEIDTYEDAIKISSEVAPSREYSAVRRAPALCFLRDESSVKNQLSKEVLGELINTKFYSRTFGLSLSEDTLSSSDYNFKPASLFRILLVFRILGWDNLIMVSPDLLIQAKLLKEKNGSAIAVTKQQYIRDNIIVAVFSAIIGGLSVWLYLRFGFYGLSSILLFLLPYFLNMRRTTKGDWVKND